MLQSINQLIKHFSKFRVIFLFIFTLCSGAVQAARPFIIDTDVGVDDVVAMLYLLQRPDISVKAITIASTQQFSANKASPRFSH
jgi:hypothetical protein